MIKDPEKLHIKYADKFEASASGTLAIRALLIICVLGTFVIAMAFLL